MKYKVTACLVLLGLLQAGSFANADEINENDSEKIEVCQIDPSAAQGLDVASADCFGDLVSSPHRTPKATAYAHHGPGYGGRPYYPYPVRPPFPHPIPGPVFPPRPFPGPGPIYPLRPYPGPYPYPPVPSGFVCSARNVRGQLFQARGFDPRFTQERAMDQCYRVSVYCDRLGCRRY